MTKPQGWTRSDHDEWDITSSVGYTALLVAGWRALHTNDPQPLARDQYAKHFITAAADPYLTGLLASPGTSEGARAFPRLYGTQTRFFDEFFMSATNSGVRQAVILGAGLDSRPYRLPWPNGTTVFEVDQPKVLEFKAQVLAEHDVKRATGHANVAADLREDWSIAMQAKAFDAQRSTAWSLEGVLPYLTAEAQDALLGRIDQLSAPGSRIAIGALGSLERGQLADLEAIYPGLSMSTDLDLSALTYADKAKTTPQRWLADHGWTVNPIRTTLELQGQYGRTPHDVDLRIDKIMRSQYITALR